jgi:hypothetical protein
MLNEQETDVKNHKLRKQPFYIKITINLNTEKGFLALKTICKCYIGHIALRNLTKIEVSNMRISKKKVSYKLEDFSI